MAFTISFIKPASYPADDTSAVGGAIDGTDTAFSGTLGELFASTTSGFIGSAGVSRFMKIYIKNTGDPINDLTLFFQNVEYPEQLSFAWEKTADDSASNVLTMPSGYVNADFLSPIGLINGELASPSSLATSSDIAIWVRLVIPSGLAADSAATATLSVAGTV